MIKVLRTLRSVTNKPYSELIKLEIINNEKFCNILKILLNDKDIDINDLNIEIIMRKNNILCIIEDKISFDIILFDNIVCLVDIQRYIGFHLMLKVDGINIDNIKQLKNFKYILFYNSIKWVLENPVKSLADLLNNIALILLVLNTTDKQMFNHYIDDLLKEIHGITDLFTNDIDNELPVYNEALKFIKDRFETELKGYERLYEEKIEDIIITV